jgi:hypothetical protein
MKEAHIVTKQMDKDSTHSASLIFNWVTDVNASIGSVLIMFININPTSINTLTPAEPILTIHISQPRPILSEPIVYGVTGWNGFHQVYRIKLLKYYINCPSFFYAKKIQKYI